VKNFSPAFVLSANLYGSVIFNYGSSFFYDLMQLNVLFLHLLSNECAAGKQTEISTKKNIL